MFDVAAKLCGRILVLSDVTLASVLREFVLRCSSDLDGDGLEVVWLSPFDGITGTWYWYCPLLSGQAVRIVVDRRHQLDVILASAFRASVPRRLRDVDGEGLAVGWLSLLNEVTWLAVALPCSGKIVTCFVDNRRQQVSTCLDVTVVLAQRRPVNVSVLDLDGDDDGLEDAHHSPHKMIGAPWLWEDVDASECPGLATVRREE